MMVYIVVLSVIMLLLAIEAVIHMTSSHVTRADHIASNARVLKEFKQMSIYRPEQIIDRTDI